MKHTRLILISLLAICLLLVGGVGAVTWTSAGGCWTATDGAYTIVMWNATGTSSWTPPSGVTSVEYLVVAGGGGAQTGNVGGAGAGGYLEGSLFVGLSSHLETIVVGSGGLGEGAGELRPYQGGNSSIKSTTHADVESVGGVGYATTSEKVGGSGSGGGVNNVGQGSGTVGQGYGGGTGQDPSAPPYNTGGGGGAGQVGYNHDDATYPMRGGAGKPSSITGTLTYYAGGGGGSTVSFAQSYGGLGGGGRGMVENSISATAGTPNTGGGAGGGTPGPSGGSGIVIIKYLTPTAPVASFTPTGSVSGTSPYTVSLTDTSTGTPTSWAWARKNLTATTWAVFNTSQNAQDSFVAGNWSVNLSATNAYGTGISAQTLWVNVSQPIPVVSFTPTGTTTGTAPLSVSFTDTSTNTPTGWNWGAKNVTGNNTWFTFDAVNQNPTGVFGVGNFTINLSATNSGGTGYSTQITWVNVSAGSGATKPIAISSLSRATMPVGSYAFFNDTSLNTPTAWCWTFAPGYYAAVANGSVYYYQRGIFNVTSNVSNSAGFNLSYNIVRVI